MLAEFIPDQPVQVYFEFAPGGIGGVGQGGGGRGAPGAGGVSD